MKKKLLAVLLMIMVLLCCLAGCDPNKRDPGNDVVDDEDAHYLIFTIEGSEKAKMLVVETDTRESLEPYFPTIPARAGYIGYWEIDGDIVYSSTQNEIYAHATYYKQQP